MTTYGAVVDMEPDVDMALAFGKKKEHDSCCNTKCCGISLVVVIIFFIIARSMFLGMFEVGPIPTSPNKVASYPQPSEEVQAERKLNAETCACPFLKTGYVQGKLPVDSNGYAPLEAVYNLMDWAGAGRSAFPTAGYFNKFGISGVPVTHLERNRPNDSGILHPWIGEEERQQRLEKFLSFSNTHGSFDAVGMSNAVQYYVELTKANSVFGPYGELSTILTVFGSKRGVLTSDDVAALWIRNEWPTDWDKKHRTPETAPFTSIDAMMAYRIGCMFMNTKEGVTTDNPPNMFKPFDVFPVSDNPDGTVITPEEIALIPGGEMCLYDSRRGEFSLCLRANNTGISRR
jgi:hypothetical protein